MISARKFMGMGIAAAMLAAPAVSSAQTAGGIFAPPSAQKPEPPIVHAGKPVTATEVVAGQNQMPMLQSNGAELLQADLARLQSVQAQGGFPQVPPGAYKKGDTGPGVGALNMRLYLENYLQVEGTQGQYAQLFTTATQQGLMRFQRNHGLQVTGKVDQATLTEFNVPVQNRIATIEANIPRLQAYQASLGDRYIIVNIPAQQLEAVQGGRVFERHNTIVGRPARPSPVVMTPLETVKFNPYWLAPISIVERDIIPKIQGGNFEYLTKLGIKILQGGQDGPEVNPKTLDFNHFDAKGYLFRQEPGPENAMATAKIEFRSPFGIYLHDTPEKDMFNYDNRFYSSGCIRVQNMPGLVKWVLNGQEGYDDGKIAEMAKTLARVDVPLQAPPQLRVAYLTAWPAPGGTVAFRKDIYQMDGTGFVVGQPMPVGEMSPDGKRFVLKPLPYQPSVDAAEADGTGFFGKNGAAARKAKPNGVPLVPPRAPQPMQQNSANPKPLFPGVPLKNTGLAKPGKATKAVPVAQTASKPATGLFDWAAYRKKQAAEAAAASKKVKKKPKKPTAKVKAATN